MVISKRKEGPPKIEKKWEPGAGLSGVTEGEVSARRQEEKTAEAAEKRSKEEAGRIKRIEQMLRGEENAEEFERKAKWILEKQQEHEAFLEGMRERGMRESSIKEQAEIQKSSLGEVIGDFTEKWAIDGEKIEPSLVRERLNEAMAETQRKEAEEAAAAVEEAGRIIKEKEAGKLDGKELGEARGELEEAYEKEAIGEMPKEEKVEKEKIEEGKEVEV